MLPLNNLVEIYEPIGGLMGFLCENHRIKTGAILRIMAPSIVCYHAAVKVLNLAAQMLLFLVCLFLVQGMELEGDLGDIVLTHDYTKDLLLPLEEMNRGFPF